MNDIKTGLGYEYTQKIIGAYNDFNIQRLVKVFNTM